MMQAFNIKDDIRSKTTNAEILSVAYMAMIDFRGNYRKAHLYAMGLKLIKPLDYSRFIRRVNQLQETIEILFAVLGSFFQKVHNLAIYAIDSFPVEMCQIQREKRCRLWQQPELKGYNASKRKYFYGFKVHLIATTNKEPVLCTISCGKEHDIDVAYPLISQLPKGSINIGDKGYVSARLEQELSKLGIDHKPIYRANQNIADVELPTKKRLRKSIETLFSTITERFGKVIKATSINGFLTKLKMHLLAYQLECVLKADTPKQQALFAMIGK